MGKEQQLQGLKKVFFLFFFLHENVSEKPLHPPKLCLGVPRHLIHFLFLTYLESWMVLLKNERCPCTEVKVAVSSAPRGIFGPGFEIQQDISFL